MNYILSIFSIYKEIWCFKKSKLKKKKKDEYENLNIRIINIDLNLEKEDLVSLYMWS